MKIESQISMKLIRYNNTLFILHILKLIFDKTVFSSLTDTDIVIYQ